MRLELKSKWVLIYQVIVQIVPIFLIFFPIARTISIPEVPQLKYNPMFLIDIFGRMTSKWRITEEAAESIFLHSSYIMIIPLTILGIILPFVFSFSLMKPKQKRALGSRQDFLLHRIFRFQIFLGGVFGFTAMMIFFRFMAKWSAFLALGEYQYNALFYLAILSFVSTIIVGLYSTFQVIRLSPKIDDEIEKT